MQTVNKSKKAAEKEEYYITQPAWNYNANFEYIRNETVNGEF